MSTHNDVLSGHSSERRPSRWAPVYLAAVLALRVVLLPVFYLVLTPVGVLLRLAGIDFMRRRVDPGEKTYWINRDKIS